jgi:hypothetical protein
MPQKESSERDVVSMAGVATLAEELEKRMPRITFGKEEPKELKDGEIYLQHE